jgi:ferredoxin
MVRASTLDDTRGRTGRQAKLLSGKVSMAVQDALTDHAKAEGYILACQAKIQGGVCVDA